VLREDLAVMDATAVVLCKEHGMPLRVMNLNVEGALQRVVQGEDVGTLVTSGEES
jgi:uridylate kinase